MKKTLFFWLLMGVGQLGSGCQTEADIRPATYDALALATGHWEWVQSTYGFSPARTPATLGMMRQLVFGEGGQLTVRRSGQADYHTSYQLSMGPLPHCGQPAPNVPLLTFTSESDLPNNETKTYHLGQQSGRQTLVLIGADACLDGGAYEQYTWVAE